MSLFEVGYSVWNRLYVKGLKPIFVMATLVALVAGFFAGDYRNQSTSSLVRVVAHNHGAEKEYGELVLRGEQERPVYQKLLQDGDEDVRWMSACMLDNLGNLSSDAAVREYLVRVQNERDPAVAVFLTTICQEGSAKSDAFVSDLLTRNPKLNRMTVFHLLSRKRDDDRHFRRFVQKQTSPTVLLSVQSSLGQYGPNPRINDLIDFVNRRLKESGV